MKKEYKLQDGRTAVFKYDANGIGKITVEAMDCLIDMLPKWIPCSERLPPELKPVNVTWINRQPPTYYEKLKDKPFTDTAVYYEGKWYWQSAVCVDLLKEYGESPADDIAYEIEIVAWMPLPEPYREEDANG